MSEKIDMIGKVFGDWQVISDDPNKSRYYICKCIHCGQEKSIQGYSLRKGLSLTCSCKNPNKHFKDETGNRYGMLTVIKYLGNRKWLCKCDCGALTIGSGKDLRNGDKKTCGNHRFDDLTGKKFGELTVINYAGNLRWNCLCSCGNRVSILAQNLKNGRSRSCGCKAGEFRGEAFKKTMISKYGEVSTHRIDNPRNSQLIEAIKSKENLKDFINKIHNELNRKPFVNEVANRLDTSYTSTIKKIHEFELDSYVAFNTSRSLEEIELENYIKSIYSGTIEHNRRDIVPKNELDIYLPDKKLAIEYNGVYWHNEFNKPINYHFDKTISCKDSGIRLIHIFEYEWLNESKKKKLKDYLKHMLCNNTIIYARKCNILKIDTIEANKFLDNTHLQGAVQCSIAYGLYYNNNLIGVMTFGKPRFNTEYEYELLRMSFLPEIEVIGGASKLFSTFIKEFKPKSIISYCNLSKFTGNVYNKLGFKLIKYSSPNYVWCNDKYKIYPRYATMKKKLISLGYGNEQMSESDIMHSLNFYKIYDSGNAVYTWEDKERT